MEVIRFLRRMVLGVPLLLPAYAVNIGSVFLLINEFHFTTIGVLSAVIIGDAIAYTFNIYLSPWILLYMKRTRYFTRDELSR